MGERGWRHAYSYREEDERRGQIVCTVKEGSGEGEGEEAGAAG